MINDEQMNRLCIHVRNLILSLKNHFDLKKVIKEITDYIDQNKDPENFDEHFFNEYLGK